MTINYREGEKKDSSDIARLDNIASDGAIEFLYHDLIPNMRPVQIVASNLENDSYPHSYRSAIIAEYKRTIVGMSLSFPGKYHRITKEMKNFFPKNRINHFKDFFSAPVKNSYFLDAICVDEDFRSKGIGTTLIEKTKIKAVKEGYKSLCLLVFKDNVKAQRMYKKNGFEVIDRVDLAAHELMPHEGGCLLMKSDIKEDSS